MIGGAQQQERVFDLSGRVALVTGAGRNIGRGVARWLARGGAAVVVNDIDPRRADAVAADISAAGGNAMGAAADVTERGQVEHLVRTAVARFGPVDVLVNNAGNAGAGRGFAPSPPPFWESDPGDWGPWFDVNLFGVMLASRAVLPSMVERRHGRIITIVSDAGRVGEPALVPYSAAKAGAAGFVRALAREAGRFDVTVNAVSLGSVRESTAVSEATGGLSIEEAERVERQLRRYVLRRFGTPDDVAGMVRFLASDAASWITGQTFPVNGGYSFAQ